MSLRKIKTAPTFEEAKRRYLHRYTLEHIPAWAGTVCGNGLYYAPQYATDAEWYAAGVWDEAGDLWSSGQTWPMGRWLDAPFRQGGKTATPEHVAKLIKVRIKEAENAFKDELADVKKLAEEFGLTSWDVA